MSLIPQRNISLKNYNTFRVDVQAKYFISVTTTAELIAFVTQHTPPPNIFVLGGGSNMLLLRNIDALVLHVNTKGIAIVHEDDATVTVNVAAGENWHEFVVWTLDRQYGGLENLSLIPGNVGAAPIQNIGAYGVELKDVFLKCETVSLNTGMLKQFTHSECQFGYRDSIFKNAAKGQYIITSVTLKLTKKNHKLHTQYGSIQNILREKGITQPTLKEISDAVIAIRSSKLPDPAVLGNGGSFFKNPVISASHLNTIKGKFPDIPSYPVADPDKVKVPAGWLIEQCGLKGKRMGNAGVHEKQALVLVNYGNASGKEILELSKSIQAIVKQHFNIILETEVNIV